MDKMVRVARLEELSEVQGTCVEVEGRSIALFRRADEVLAIDDACPHRGASLSYGEREGDWVTCLLHNWCFHLRTGAMRGGAGGNLATFPVEVKDGEVFVGAKPKAA